MSDSDSDDLISLVGGSSSRFFRSVQSKKKKRQLDMMSGNDSPRKKVKVRFRLSHKRERVFITS